MPEIYETNFHFFFFFAFDDINKHSPDGFLVQRYRSLGLKLSTLGTYHSRESASARPSLLVGDRPAFLRQSPLQWGRQSDQVAHIVASGTQYLLICWLG